MKYYYIGDTLNDEAAEKFTSFISSNPEEDLTIYISSPGGNVDAMGVLLHAINKNAHRIILVATGAIYSCAFILFYSVKCEREILEGASGLYHYLGNTGMRFTAGGVPDNPTDRAKYKETKKDAKKEIDWCKKLGMNKEEIEIIKRSDEAFFSNERLREFLEKQEEEMSPY